MWKESRYIDLTATLNRFSQIRFYNLIMAILYWDIQYDVVLFKINVVIHCLLLAPKDLNKSLYKKNQKSKNQILSLVNIDKIIYFSCDIC